SRATPCTVRMSHSSAALVALLCTSALTEWHRAAEIRRIPVSRFHIGAKRDGQIRYECTINPVHLYSIMRGTFVNVPLAGRSWLGMVAVHRLRKHRGSHSPVSSLPF